MVFPIVIYRCEGWTIKKAEHQRTDAFELWCLLEKILESCLDCKETKPVNPKGNQLWIFIGRTDAEAPIHSPPDVKSRLMLKTLILGNIERIRRRGWQRMRWLDNITNSTDMNLNKLQEIVEDWGAWHAAVPGITYTTQQLNNKKPLQQQIWKLDKIGPWKKAQLSKTERRINRKYEEFKY